jgi:hypothetical protein
MQETRCSCAQARGPTFGEPTRIASAESRPVYSLPVIFQVVILGSMSDLTRILGAIDRGEAHTIEQLLPLVYEELRRLAAAQMAHEKPGQTLQATALVHQAFLRLVGKEAEHRCFF